jgi:THO complex subunit 2
MSIDFKLVSVAAASSFESGKSKEIEGLVQEHFKSYSDSSGKQDADAEPHPFKRVLYELCWHVIGGKVAPTNLVKLLSSLDAADGTFPSDFADVLWLVGMEVENKDSDEWGKLCTLVKVIAGEDLVSVQALKTVLEADLLQGGGLVEDATAFTKKIVKMNTKNLYTQQKYNLLSEESEGYAKLITLLGSLTQDNVDSTIQDMRALIGYFDLDPNRVFDLVLENFEMNPEVDHFKLIDQFRASNLAHILGFKFQFYVGENAKKEPEIAQTPDSLYRMTALLVAGGKVTLDELYPHLHPAPAVMQKRYQARETSFMKAASTFGVTNLAASSQENQTAQKEKESAEKKQKDQTEDEDRKNQYLGLLHGLLRVRSFVLAQTLFKQLSEFGVTPCSYPPVATALCDLIHHTIDPLYQQVSPRTKVIISSASSSSASAAGADDLVLAKDAVPQVPADGWGGFGPAAWPLLKQLGVELQTDIPLLTKLCRLLAHIFQEHMELWTNADSKKPLNFILAQTLLPALSLLPPNPGLVYELWEAMKLLSFADRYNTYGYWRGVAYEKHPALIMAKAKAVNATKKIMRRVAKENVKQIGRGLAKIAHSNPVIVFDAILSQIEAYDNLIQPMVDSFKYLTPLGFDILSFMLITYLASSRRPKLKADGQHFSQWLLSLSQFTGVLYRKYPTMELGGLLQYQVSCLKAGQSLDLLVLSSLLARMGGCEMVENIGDRQLDGRAGGVTLCTETADFAKPPNKKCVSRLREALLKNNVAVPLIVLIAQQRAAILFKTETEYLKLLGYLYDACQLALVQLCQFLGSSVPLADFRKLVPPFETMVNSYNMDPAIAFRLLRPAYQEEHRVTAKQLQNSSATPEWKPYNEPLLAAIKALNVKEESSFGGACWDSLSPQLYLTFWSMSLYDIFNPLARYDSELTRIEKQHRELDRKRSDPDATANTDRKRKKDMEKISTKMTQIKTERADQIAHCRHVLSTLRKAKEGWLSDVKLCGNKSSKLTACLLQMCVLPRALLSPEDAIYTAKFFEKLHDIETAHFSSLQYYDKLLKEILPTIFCVTEAEAANLGYFLNETLKSLNRWASDRKTFGKECNKCGFSVNFADTSKGKKASYEEYKKVYVKWQASITKIMVASLQSTEYMEIRNTLIVLRKMVKVYPASARVYLILDKEIVRIKENEARDDLKLMAKSYFAMLQNEKKRIPDLDTKPAAKSAPKKSSVPAAKSAPKKSSVPETSAAPAAKRAKTESAPAPKKYSGKDGSDDGGRRSSTGADSKGGKSESKGGKSEKTGTGGVKLEKDSGRGKRDEEKLPKDSKDNGRGGRNEGNGDRNQGRGGVRGGDGKDRGRDKEESMQKAAKASVVASKVAAERGTGARGSGGRDSRDAKNDGGREGARDRDRDGGRDGGKGGGKGRDRGGRDQGKGGREGGRDGGKGGDGGRDRDGGKGGGKGGRDSRKRGRDDAPESNQPPKKVATALSRKKEQPARQQRNRR